MSYNPNNPRPLTPSQNHINSNYSTKPNCSITFSPNSPFTKQEFREECDINTIMSRYQYSGEIPVLNQQAPQYLDVCGSDYQEAMQFVAGAKTLFNELPSAIRNRFDNDPALFLDFTSQDKNRAEMAGMGLLKPESEWAILSPTQNEQTGVMPVSVPNEPNLTNPHPNPKSS
ncbi:MAG: internal scaffolding protein [Microviridae sp.]|nr:MAG: internal scaffolding protein [Microviridae sp.]